MAFHLCGLLSFCNQLWRPLLVKWQNAFFFGTPKPRDSFHSTVKKKNLVPLLTTVTQAATYSSAASTAPHCLQKPFVWSSDPKKPISFNWLPSLKRLSSNSLMTVCLLPGSPWIFTGGKFKIQTRWTVWMTHPFEMVSLCLERNVQWNQKSLLAHLFMMLEIFFFFLQPFKRNK